MASIFDAARETWEAEFGLLNRIAHHVYHSDHGGFIRKFADAWLHADADNKMILKPAWIRLIDKYSLEKELEEEAEA